MLRTAKKKGKQKDSLSKNISELKIHFMCVSVSVSYPGDLTEPLLHQLCVQLLDPLLITEIGRVKESQKNNKKQTRHHVSLEFTSI